METTVKINRQINKYSRYVRRLVRVALNEYKSQMFKFMESRPVDQWDNINFHKDVMESAYLKIYSTICPQFAKQTALMKEDIEPFWVGYFKRYVKKNLGQRITLVTHTTEEEYKRIVRNVTSEGMLNAWGSNQVGREIRKQIGFSNVYRGERIARTELLSSANVGSIEGARSAGVEMEKQWMTGLDERVRESHAALNGIRVGLNDRFPGGLDFPGDPSGPAEEVINCRCVLTYHVVR